MRAVIVGEHIFAVASCLPLVAVVVRLVVAHNVFQTGLNGVYRVDRRREIHQESVLQRILLALVALLVHAVQEVEPAVVGTHVRIIETAVRAVRIRVYPVREGQHTVFHMEKSLIVYAAVDGRPAVVRYIMRRVTVYRVARKRRCGIGGVCGSALVSTAIHTERHAYQTQRINLVAGFQRTILEVGSALLRAGRLDIRRVFVYLAYALTLAPAVVTGSTVGVAVVIVYADSELSALHSAEQSASLSAVVHVGRRRSGVSHKAAALGYDIKYAAHSLGIVFRSGVGYHLNTLHAVCRKAFKHLLRVVAHHVVRASVDINLERTAAVHLYVVIPIYRHERHLAQHFEHRVRL